TCDNTGRLNNPTQGQDWCFEAPTNVLKVWSGTGWIPAQPGAATGIINVKDFGATGNGTTDDRLAIVAAVAALPTTGGAMPFPPGTYLVNSSSPIINLTDRNSVTVACAGREATTLHQSGLG